MERAIDNTGRNNVTAIVACDVGRSSPQLAAVLAEFAMGRSVHVDDCDVYEPAPV
jgi:hypothetical protein